MLQALSCHRFLSCQRGLRKKWVKLQVLAPRRLGVSSPSKLRTIAGVSFYPLRDYEIRVRVTDLSDRADKLLSI